MNLELALFFLQCINLVHKGFGCGAMEEADQFQLRTSAQVNLQVVQIHLLNRGGVAFLWGAS
ncbi:MAG: hypothetical protein ACKOJE_06340, partial [Bacteroidota bacterium]